MENNKRMKNRHILFGTMDPIENGLDIGDSLSEQLGCFSVAVTGVAAATTAVITTIVSVITISHWVFNFF